MHGISKQAEPPKMSLNFPAAHGHRTWGGFACRAISRSDTVPQSKTAKATAKRCKAKGSWRRLPKTKNCNACINRNTKPCAIARAVARVTWPNEVRQMFPKDVTAKLQLAKLVSTGLERKWTELSVNRHPHSTARGRQFNPTVAVLQNCKPLLLLPEPEDNAAGEISCQGWVAQTKEARCQPQQARHRSPQAPFGPSVASLCHP